MSLKFNVNWVRLAPVVAAITIAGCGGLDDIQLNGKIFDVVGLNTGPVKPKEAKLAERQPLVVPPGLEKLPVPGSGKVDQAAIGIEDHDAKRQTTKAELERQQAAFCKKNYTDAKNGDQSADSVVGPAGPCRQSIISAITKLTSSSEEGEDQ